MGYKPYSFSYNIENTHIQFQSIGKRGIFEKTIVISLIEDDIYNLALLDIDPLTQDYSDESVTDNGDMPEILATIMAIIMDYLNQYPDRRLFLTGNTNSRTRLYQIAINKVMDQISKDLVIMGRYNQEWILFKQNTNFDSFIIGRK